jgi:hypothetical protein
MTQEKIGMIRVETDFFVAGANFNQDGIIIGTAPILVGWRGQHYNKLIAYYNDKSTEFRYQIMREP